MSEEVVHSKASLAATTQMKVAKSRIPPTCGMSMKIDGKKRHKRDIGRGGMSRSDPENIYWLLKRR
jgi:hypothetical protein